MLRGQMQQPLNAEMLTQQQQMSSNNSPKRDGRTLLSQNIIHQSYGVAQQSASGISGNVIAAGSMIGAGIPVSANNTVGAAGSRQRPVAAPGIGNIGSGSNASTFIPGNPNMTGILPQHLSMAYYSQTPPSQSYFGEVLHPTQV